MVAQQQQSPSQINGSEPDNDYLFDIANDDPEEPLDGKLVRKRNSCQLYELYIICIRLKPPRKTRLDFNVANI